jgi:hypothetical protein
MRFLRTALPALVLALACAPAAVAGGGGSGYPGPAAGGTAPGQVVPQLQPTEPQAPAPPPTATATVAPDGRGIPPRGAPRLVRRVFVAANRLVRKRYRWGGGHRRFAPLDRGYDCSGAVSYALYGGRLLLSPLDSSGLARFGESGPGSWITLYANRTHVYMVVAGLRFDTGAHDAATLPRGTGPRWHATPRSPRGFKVRHPSGL